MNIVTIGMQLGHESHLLEEINSYYIIHTHTHIYTTLHYYTQVEIALFECFSHFVQCSIEYALTIVM